MSTKLNATKQKRADMVEAGAYDGRYKPKVMPSKKKQMAREWARKKEKNEKTN